LEVEPAMLINEMTELIIGDSLVYWSYTL